MWKHAAVMGLLVLGVGAARAQAPTGTSAANPAVATQRVAPETPLERPKPDQVDFGNVPLAPRPRTVVTDPSAATVRFAVSRVRFTGVTLLSAAELAAMSRPYEGREVTLTELLELAAKVRDRYRARGYL